jgi:hypothetical protein
MIISGYINYYWWILVVINDYCISGYILFDINVIIFVVIGVILLMTIGDYSIINH